MMAIIVRRITPYHGARFGSLRRRMRFHVIEVSGDIGGHRAEHIKGERQYDVTTLFRQWPSSQQAVQDGVLSILDSLRPEVIAITGWVFCESMAALWWALRRSVPTVVMSDSHRRTSVPRELGRRLLIDSFDTALVAGGPQVRLMLRHKMNPANVFVGYNAVDNDHFAYGADRARRDQDRVRRRYGLPRQYVLAVARMVSEKNYPGLVEAFHRYRQRGGIRKLVIVGEGPERDVIERCIADFRLEDVVQVRGLEGYDTLPSLYGLADALILASARESWGLVVNEAMAAGLPVLVSNRCGCAEDLVRPGVNGYVFAASDTDEIADALCKLEAVDSVEMGRRSRELIRPWGLEAFSSGFTSAAIRAASLRSTRSMSLLRVRAIRLLSAVASQ